MTPQTSADAAVPEIVGGRCAHCGLVYFPFQSYGCDRCGTAGAGLIELALMCEGVLECSVAYDPPADEGGRVQIGEVRLDAGPLIRALVDPAVRAGERVRAAEARDQPGGIVFFGDGPR